VLTDGAGGSNAADQPAQALLIETVRIELSTE